MPYASVSTWILGALLLVLIVLTAVLIGLTLRGQRRQHQELRHFQEQLWKGLEGMEDDLLEQNAAQRRELSETMQRTSDGQISLLSSVLKMQGDQLNSLLERNDARMESLRRTLDEGLQRISGENRRQLEEMRQTVDEKLHETLNKRLGESFSLVNERLEQVYKGLGEMQSLATGVGDLKRVLSNVKTRGIWGEVQLGTLLSQMLAPGQYAENVAVVPGSAERVEFAVILPGRDDTHKIYLPIDSKFPMEDYDRLLTAVDGGDPTQVNAASNELCGAIRIEAKRIAKKYIVPPYTTDFAVMFLATEGLYAEALRSRGLMEELQQNQRVLIAGPSTLSALLSSLQLGFRTLAIEQRSAEVWQLLGAVKTEFGRFSDLLDQTQQRLRQAGETIEKASVRTRAINRRLRDVEALSDAQSVKLLPLDDAQDEESAS